jgi:chemotaxis protein CheC
MEDLNFSNEQLDALKEIGNIGSGNAATALSQLLDKKIAVDIPQVKFVSLEELSGLDLLNSPQDLSIAVSFKILGKLRGGVVVLYPQRSALLLIDILARRQIGSTEVFHLIDESALKETAHIISCSYLNAVGQLINIYDLVPSVQDISVDRKDKLNKVMLKRFVSDKMNFILPIENNLSIEDLKLNLFVIFLLEQESIKKVFNTVGL